MNGELTIAENWGYFYVPPHCENDPYTCDCQDCAGERDLDFARQFRLDCETL